MAKLNIKDMLSAAFAGVAVLLAVIAASLYLAKGTTIFNPDLDARVYVPTFIAVAILLASTVFSAKLGKYVSYLLLLYALISWISTQATYITNVFVSIDGSTFSASFLCIAIFLVLAIAFSLTSAILNTEPLFKLPSLKVKEDVV